MSLGIDELYFKTIRWQHLDDGSDITNLDAVAFGRIQDSHDIQ